MLLVVKIPYLLQFKSMQQQPIQRDKDETTNHDNILLCDSDGAKSTETLPRRIDVDSLDDTSD